MGGSQNLKLVPSVPKLKVRKIRGLRPVLSSRCSTPAMLRPNLQTPNIVFSVSMIITQNTWLIQASPMAKAKPMPTVEKMVSILRYGVNALSYLNESSKRFYSNLTTIPTSTYDQLKKEFEEHEKTRFDKRDKTNSKEVLLKLNTVKVSRL